MKVEICKSVAGYYPDSGDEYVFNTGDVVDLDEKTAKQFLSGDDPIAKPITKRAINAAKKAVQRSGRESR